MTAAGGIAAYGPRDRQRIALTFDDGPGGGTQAVLNLLAEHHARGTFFMVGEQVEREPVLARAVLDAGHEVGSHSMRHLEHQHADRDDVVKDMLEGARVIERELGVEPQLYRAPYGHFAPGTLAEADRRGWTCVLWSASGEDWREGETGESISTRILPDLVPGAIVLLHDARRAKPTNCAPMLEGLALVLEESNKRGLVPVTVGELLFGPTDA